MNRGELPPEGVDVQALRNYVMRKEFEEDRTRQRQNPGSTKDFAFAGTAQELKIPRQHWDHPAVRDFVQVYNDILQLRNDIPSIARAAVPDGRRRIHFGLLDGELDLGPRLEDRYGAVDELLKASVQIMQEGMPDTFPGQKHYPNIAGLGFSVSRALKRYGLVLMETLRS